VITTFELADLPLAGSAGSVVSIGVFDGVHLGHQAILRANVARARARDLVATVVTFRSHPKKILLGRAPRTLTTLGHRLELFRRFGVQHAVALQFDEQLRNIPADEFTRSILVERLRAECFVLGFDSKFGRDRTGGSESLRDAGFEVEVVEKVVVDQRGVSSSVIRESIELGDLEGAGRMLGRPAAVYGEVVRGAEVGRTLGFPTANLDLHHELHPPTGVYACRARILGSPSGSDDPAAHPAVTNIGYRPTVAGQRLEHPLVEVHFIDFEANLYGAHVELEFVQRIRGERHFDGLDALKAQIGRDVAEARGILDVPGPSPGPGLE
jgi:riboflavin kinase/FMN adenylyltransferase